MSGHRGEGLRRVVLAERIVGDLASRERAIWGLPEGKGVELRVAERRARDENREANQGLGLSFWVPGVGRRVSDMSLPSPLIACP